MAADSVTVTMTETVTYELTVTHDRLADRLDVAADAVPRLLADVARWNATGPIENQCGPLDEIDSDTHRAGSEDRTWSIRATGTTDVPPLTTQPAQITDPVRGIAAHSEYARAAVQMAARGCSILDLVDAYDGNTYRLLRDLGDHLDVSLAYVDRPTVEAHLERTLSEAEWTATSDQFTALDFDEHVGEHGTFRTDWIETLLEKAGVPGYGYTADGQTTSQPTPARGAAA